MASKSVNLAKVVYNKNQYEKVIDTKFSQLATSISQPIQDGTSVLPTNEDIDKFFQDYQNLFFSIPKLGETNSHEYLIKQSTEYVGASFTNDELQALIEEINILQQQNLELNQQLANLQTQTSPNT